MAVPAENLVYDLRDTLDEFIRTTSIEFTKVYNAQLRNEIEFRNFKDEMKAFKDEMLEFKDEMRAFKDEMKVFKDEMLEFKDEMRAFKDEMKAFKDEMLEFKDEMRAFKDEMKVFKDEMSEFKDEMLEFKDEMKVFKDDTQAFKDEMRAFKDEAVEDRKRMNKQWGELANRLGTIVEDIVAPNMEGIAANYFGCTELDSLMVRCRRRKPSDRTKIREFDVVAVCGDRIFFNETKSNARMDYAKEFIDFIASQEFFEFFPEYKGKELIPIFSSLYISDDVVQLLTQAGIYAMAMSDDSMDLLNFEEVSQKRQKA